MRRCSSTCALPVQASAAARHAYPAIVLSTHAGSTLSCRETVFHSKHRIDAIIDLRRCSGTCALPFQASAADRHAYPATFFCSQAGLTLSCPETMLQCEHRNEAIVALRRCSATCGLRSEAIAAASQDHPAAPAYSWRITHKPHHVKTAVHETNLYLSIQIKLTQDELQWIVAQRLLSALTIPGFS